MSDKIVIFDMDGVIVDTEPIYRKLSDRLYESLGINLTKEDQYALAGSVSQDKWTLLKKQFNLKYPIEELMKMSSGIKYDYLANEENEIPLIEGVDKLILSLKSRGIMMCVASSSRRKNIEIILKRVGLISYFEYIVSGSDVEKGKPHPEIFLRAASMFDDNILNFTVIEDTNNGVRAAKSAKMKCVGFSNPNSGTQNISSADIIVDNFGDESISRIINLVLK
ncbi:HAD superfamily hydrolase (TIGR01509 family) [Clostridium acetobutylicum]|uniref:Beta-phosphoglucomutase, putative n=3 Tax=Clostridium acetobutylicum TaxID=1488 RepID=Q97MN9_CLOAB|nr:MULTISPECIES: HAD family hydrolase [Clostridium]AAK78137.1 Beta-phosphoglucomutase, putative [Clostridium acetobutylicum ATCC 824]ADZ19197.1 Beta-phosphoglucomutase, putative [Clostridium acetobutylicum EA 2018]AEI34401.1 Beta-phosphoglucomutase [Clostridium acetobutylicum DSM 1731]AWV81943.1 HAD family hydrolase [Clostridium acetobutylicum]MBC2395991.1 HAD family hydrolase [Clostridium acetobutylicum]